MKTTSKQLMGEDSKHLKDDIRHKKNININPPESDSDESGSNFSESPLRKEALMKPATKSQYNNKRRDRDMNSDHHRKNDHVNKEKIAHRDDLRARLSDLKEKNL